jgi:hypothetical protein
MAKSSIFISYGHKDRLFVRRLIADLRSLGASIWLDESHILVGDSLIERLRRGIDETEFVGAVISRHSVSSSWVRRELDIAMHEEIDGKRVKVLPILIDQVDLPLFLKGKFFADFRETTRYEEGLAHLAARLQLDFDHPPLPTEGQGLEARIRGEIYNRLGMALMSLDLEAIHSHIRSGEEASKRWIRGNAHTSWVHGWDTLDGELIESSVRVFDELDERLARIRSLVYGEGAVYREAARFFKEAAYLGDLEGMWNLAWRYELGEGVIPSRAKALLWWQRAASHFHSASVQKLLELSAQDASLES